MRWVLLVYFWLFWVPAQSTDTSFQSLFVVKTDTDNNGGCAQYLDQFETFIAECKELVNAGLQVFEDAAKPVSTREGRVARSYLWTYFRINDDAEAMALVKDYLTTVKKFLNGETSRTKAHLYCNDGWLEKEHLTDAAKDRDGNDRWQYYPDGSRAPYAIFQIPEYREYLFFENDDGMWEPIPDQVPYWSDDLKDYIFDSNYKGKTYCASPDNLAVTQQRTEPNTMTFCPRALKKRTDVTVTLGSRAPTAGRSIQYNLPLSGTLYHELFHLTVGNDKTYDVDYEFSEQQKKLMGDPNQPVEGQTKDYVSLIRENPETYLFFSVGYWYFQQTKWGTAAKPNRRWSFHTGVAQLIA